MLFKGSSRAKACCEAAGEQEVLAYCLLILLLRSCLFWKFIHNKGGVLWMSATAELLIDQNNMNLNNSLPTEVHSPQFIWHDSCPVSFLDYLSQLKSFHCCLLENRCSLCPLKSIFYNKLSHSPLCCSLFRTHCCHSAGARRGVRSLICQSGGL